MSPIFSPTISVPVVTSELADIIEHAATPLPPSLRGSLSAQVLARLRTYPAQAIGVGLAHRLAAEERRSFLKAGPLAVGVGGKDVVPRDPCCAGLLSASRCGGIAQRRYRALPIPSAQA